MKTQETLTMSILRSIYSETLLSFKDEIEVDYANNQYGLAFAFTSDLEDVRKVHPYESGIELDEIVVHTDLELSNTFVEEANSSKKMDFQSVVAELVQDVLEKLAKKEDAIFAF